MLSNKQRNAIKKRDNDKCQIPFEHGCNESKRPLNVHHILPRRLVSLLGLRQTTIDNPRNLITICESFHTGAYGIHPDMAQAKSEYVLNANSFGDAMLKRDEKLERLEAYWEFAWDDTLFEIANKNTNYFESKGWVFPVK